MQLPHGQRLFALMDVTDRVALSIRLHPLTRITLAGLVERGELTAGMAGMFTAMVRARRNIAVSGGPAAGKTTLLRALARAIPRHERVFTVEDAYELALSREDHPDLLAMQAREPNIEGAGGYDMSRLLRASLRMTPDRVIVGEVRGAEVVQMAKAMSIGIDGSMATVHASSSRQALARLVAYAMEPPASYPRDAAIALIAGAVHYVIHLDMAPDGARVVSSVREVLDSDGDQIVTNEIYQPGPDRRGQLATRPRGLDALVAAGFDPALLDADRW
jgi:Flp pilus assembly CpaF family ATPase